MIPQGQPSESASHERKDVDVVGLAFVAALLFVMIGLSLLICGGVLHLFNRGYTGKSVSGEISSKTRGFPEPQLLVHPGSERAENDLAGKTRLETYGWIDRQAGVTHIPISRAMELLVERGLPEVGAGQTRLQLMQSRPQTDVQPENAIASPAPEGTP